MIACPIYTCHQEFDDTQAKVKHLREFHGRVVGVAISPHRPPPPEVLKEAERTR